MGQHGIYLREMSTKFYGEVKVVERGVLMHANKLAYVESYRWLQLFELSGPLCSLFCAILSSGLCHSKCPCFHWPLLFPVILMPIAYVPLSIGQPRNILENFFPILIN